MPKSVWETVSTFSNTSGGWIILGVTEKGSDFEITGVRNGEKLEQDILKAYPFWRGFYMVKIIGDSIYSDSLFLDLS